MPEDGTKPVPLREIYEHLEGTKPPLFLESYEHFPGQITKSSEVRVGRGLRRVDGRRVAVVHHAICAPDDAEGRQVPTAFLREVSQLKGLRHPNIVQLIDCFIDENVVVLDHPGEESLSNFLRGPGGDSLTRETSRALSLQLLRGLECCHSRGVSIVNLKSSQIFIDSGTATPALKIGGFNYALQYDMDEPTIMTPAYTGPDILMGSMRNTLYENDMWAAGCVISEFALGYPFFYTEHNLQWGTLMMIFQQFGTPNEETWQGVSRLPGFKDSFPKFHARPWSASFQGKLGSEGLALLSELLCMDPQYRVSARHALQHIWFRDSRAMRPGLQKHNDLTGSLLKNCSKSPLPFACEVVIRIADFAGRAKVPQLAEYERSILSSKRQLESMVASHANNLLGVEDTREVLDATVWRAKIVSWMISLCSLFKLRGKTLFLSVAIVDRFVQKRKPKTIDDLALIGCAALHIAERYHLSDPDSSVWKYARLYQERFTSSGIRAAENLVLRVCGVDLDQPTIPEFLNMLFSLNGSSQQGRAIASYLTELTLLRPQRFPPSQVAAAAVALSNRLLGREVPWPSWMRERAGYADCSGFTEESMEACVESLFGLAVQYRIGQCSPEDVNVRPIWKRYADTIDLHALFQRMRKKRINGKLSPESLYSTPSKRAKMDIEGHYQHLVGAPHQ
eukprot:TRINITY_DN22703_c0_g1_i1.p1 TRINITY_DN22703_c0_g1~~TRINITY_DN22703_c0_g1_i1.p1  ORF type:complete len:678 (+),score=103.05 TRINITY_DN22703_c0_g1_i1:107-2140(+)